MLRAISTRGKRPGCRVEDELFGSRDLHPEKFRLWLQDGHHQECHSDNHYDHNAEEQEVLPSGAGEAVVTGRRRRGRRQTGFDDARFAPGIIGGAEVVAGATDGIRSTGLLAPANRQNIKAREARESNFIFFSFHFACI